MTSTTATTVLLDVTVDVPVDTAFRLFTEHFDQVKPREYNLLDAPIEETVLEPRVGGHIYDRCADGTTCRWARVLSFDPPDRLVFTWDISPRWQLETDPARCSEVEVRFLAEGQARTRVELEHRHLDRHGEGWEEYASVMASESAWPLFLTRFEALTTDPPA